MWKNLKLKKLGTNNKYYNSKKGSKYKVFIMIFYLILSYVLNN